ncbi:MAG: SCP2 sterol-binding domain-containing protein, partial [Myxococcota bacterium]
FSVALFVPPGWDRRYTEVFGYTLEDIGEIGVHSLQTKLRAAGLPLESLPGPAFLPPDLTAREISVRGRALLDAGILGEPWRPVRNDEASVALMVESLRGRIDTRRAPEGYTIDLAFRNAPRWHVVVADGRAIAAQGPPPVRPSVRMRSRYEDLVRVARGSVDPRRAILRGRLLVTGRPAALRLLPALLG